MSTTRIQLALNVEDVAAAAAFYEKMFGVPPHKVRDGPAGKFDIVVMCDHLPKPR